MALKRPVNEFPAALRLFDKFRENAERKGKLSHGRSVVAMGEHGLAAPKTGHIANGRPRRGIGDDGFGIEFDGGLNSRFGEKRGAFIGEDNGPGIMDIAPRLLDLDGDCGHGGYRFDGIRPMGRFSA